jgi:glucosamine-6-phosphate deaminase
VALQPETVAYILGDAGAASAVGDRAVTLGLGTIAEAREVLLLVSGPAKRDILHRALTGPVGPECPASLLQRLPRARVFADRDAAGRS